MGTRVYVGRLSSRARESDLERFFKGYGRIREIILKNNYAFVEFDDYRDADDAAYECNGKELLGDRLIVELAKGTPRGRDRLGWRGPPPSSGGGRYGERSRKSDFRTDYRVIVENLSSRVSWQDLKDHMRQVGEVTYSDTNAGRREGVVEFARSSDMKAAIDKFDGTDLNGRKIRVREEKPRKRSRSRSKDRKHRTRSKSRSRSRSRGRDKKRSRSKSRSHSKSPRRSSPSPKRRAGSRSPDGVKRERSPSPGKRDSRSRSPAKNDKDREGSEDGARAKSEPRSHEGSAERNNDRERSRSRSDRGGSRSRSRSARRSDDDEKGGENSRERPAANGDASNSEADD